MDAAIACIQPMQAMQAKASVAARKLCCQGFMCVSCFEKRNRPLFSHIRPVSPVDFTYAVLTTGQGDPTAVCTQPRLATYHRPMAQDIQQIKDLSRSNRTAWPRMERRP
jgi:hypothetical protein